MQCERTAEARTCGADVDEEFDDSTPHEEFNLKMSDPNDENGQKENGIGQWQRRQVITWTIQFIPGEKKLEEIEGVAQHAHNHYRPQVVEIEPFENLKKDQ